MNLNRPQQKDPKLAEQAAQWLTVLESGGPEERAAFARWLTESRRNVEEFLFMSAVDKVLDGADAQRRIDVEQLLAHAGGNVVALQTNISPPMAVERKRHRKALWASAAAAAVVVLGCAAAWSISELQWDSYKTIAGEQRTLELDDGSMVYMNTQSRLKVHFTKSGRDLRLLEGEALFTVAHDSARPFRVDAGGAVIQAIGTRFNVYKRPQGTTVSVLEGAVRISTEAGSTTQSESARAASGQKDGNTLKAGEEASIAVGRITRHAPAEVARVEAWRERRLMFRADTLADIAEEFNRYNRAPKIRIEGEGIAARRFTGIFDANDPESLAAFLDDYQDLTVHRDNNELIVRQR